MGGADQDMKFANSLSGEEGRRRRWQTSINLCRKLTPGIPFGDSLSVRASFLSFFLRAFSETCSKVL